MNRRTLGRTSIEVSEVSFGGVEIGIPYGIGGSEQNMLADDQAVDLLGRAVERSINFFDTARGYGKSEELMGRAFAGLRDQVVLCTKSRHFAAKGEPFPAERELADIIQQSLDESLTTLRTDHVDVYMVHNANMVVLNNHAVADAFCRCKTQGLTRAIGVSTYTVEETRKAIDAGIWDVIQLPFHLMDQRQGQLFGVAEDKGVGIVVRSVLFKGILTNRGDHLHPELKAVADHRKVYDELLTDEIPSLSDLATKFVLSHQEVSSVLIGIDRMEYLDKALAVADGEYLDAQSLARAREMSYPEPDFLDLPTWHRAGWLI